MCAAVAAMLTLTACGGGVDGKIKKINELAKENIELAQDDPIGNAEKISKNGAEMVKITNELRKADLSEEQQQDLLKAAFGQLD